MLSCRQELDRRSTRSVGRAVTAVLVAAALTVVGCADDDGPPLAGTWQLIEGVGPDGEVALVDGYPVTLEIDGEEWRGTAACNTYGATATVHGDQVEIDELFATEMACPEDDVMSSEAAYLAALGEVDEVDVDDAEAEERELHLRGPATQLTFIWTETSA